MFRTAVVAGLLVLAAPLLAADVKSKEPGPKTKGKQYEWKSGDGVSYRYRIPKGYDEEQGANLVLILHGSNLDRRWGFANHSSKEFRPCDIVVSPDGTTSNGRGGFNFLNGREDVRKFNRLIQEWKKSFKVNATFLYGHSQGSFFAFLYAGEHPDDVQGVVGHASGIWANTQRNECGHHQAIVLMHGTQDPVVPYFQSAGSYDLYVEAKYPIVRLRSLEGWNHWPAENNGPVQHTSQQIAWCEGMTTADPARMAACFGYFASGKSKERTDYAAIYSLAKRLSDHVAASEALRRRTAAAMKTVEALAQAHAKALDRVDLAKFEAKAWVGHAPKFLRALIGVPARDAFAEKWKLLLSEQAKAGGALYSKYWNSMKGNQPGNALGAGVAAVKAAYLWHRVTDAQFLKNLATWQKDGKKLGADKGALKDYAKFVKPFPKALKDGARAFDGLNRKCGKF